MTSSDLPEIETVLAQQVQRVEALLALPRLADTLPEQAFLQEALQYLEQLTQSQISFIHFINDDEQTIELVTWSKRTLDTYCHAAYDHHYPVTKAGIWADALRQRQPVVFNDYSAYPAKRGLPQGHAGMQRLISVPVISQGRVVMLTGVGNKATDYNNLDVESVQLLSNEIWNLAQRRRDILALEKQEKLFRATFEQAAVGVARLSLEGAFLQVNERFCQLVGYRADELTQMFCQDLIYPPDRARDMTERKKLRQGLISTYSLEKRYCHHNGSLIWVNCTMSFVSGDDEPSYFIAVVEDIGDRKRAEQALQQLNQDLESCIEARTYELSAFRQGVDSAAIVAITDPEGVITYVNDRFCEISGYQPEEVLGQTHKLLNSGYHPPEFFQTLWETLKSGQVWRGEVRNRRKDGSFYWTDSVLVPFLDKQGQPYQYLAIRFDITERKQYEVQLAQANEELLSASRLKDEFLANMSHELRTPLNAILGMAESLQERIFGPLTEHQQMALDTIENSGLHLLELINDVLDLAKISAGKLQLAPHYTDVAQLCHSSLTFIQQQTFQKQISVHLSLAPQLPAVWLDERRIRQALINLLNNAVKFTPVGGTITLAASLQSSLDPTQDPPLQLTVTDTGIGIPTNHLQKLFQPFIQVDSALNRQYQGAGLGLALVKQIAELHGGSITVTSTEGAGSCFTLTLPCRQGPDSLEAAPVLTPKAPSSSPSPCRLLMAMGNSANGATLLHYLRARGYELLLAEEPETLLALATTQSPDLILLDLQAPSLQGLEMIRSLRQTPTLSQMPILALTTEEREAAQCLAAGANDCLRQPVRPKELINHIHGLLVASTDRMNPGNPL
ncbi:PAS domain S-box protein [Synechocystis sp. LKSZ1]|uniref:PAS domain S-box protein n=1 Tax=Synechocystis sp. LKSZ1 TaxID=3144951 RepID=UPI00336BF34F